MEKVTALILAAGEGKRMKSTRPKVLHSVCGRTIIEHVLTSAGSSSQEQVVVVGHGAEEVMAKLGQDVRFVIQEPRLGTGHAVQQAVPLLPSEGIVLVLCGDMPLIPPTELNQLLAVYQEEKAAAVVLTALTPAPAGYGRVIRDESGSVQKIVEEKDASAAEKEIREINTGTYAFSAALLREFLNKLEKDNAQGEYYLTDCIGLLFAAGKRVSAYCMNDYRLAVGINDREQLAAAASLMREQINQELMLQGVTMVDPAAVYVDANVKVGSDTVLMPGTILQGETIIGSNCEIGPHTEIIDSKINNGVTVRHSVLRGCSLEEGAVVGPFAHLRPGTRVNKGVKIGDFVEVKNSEIGQGSKIPHLSYIGDAEVGKGVNIGAGTIVVNYDGKAKHKTNIGDNAFVGCNSSLVAPLNIGKGAFIGAGSTITKDVPDRAFALARGRQVIKEGMAVKFLPKEKT